MILETCYDISKKPEHLRAPAHNLNFTLVLVTIQSLTE